MSAGRLEAQLPGDPRRPLVYLGPSVDAPTARRIVPDAVVLPPVRREDLYRAREAGHAHILVIDGSFSHGFAVSPREVVDVIRDGAAVLGASSMGAIRAAECWPAGMVGVGLVYRLYRSGAVQSDDEVAVATNPEEGHRALSFALVNVRCAARRAVRAGLLAPAVAREVVAVAERLNFARRSWRHVFAEVAAPLDERARAFLTSVDVKREDALRGLRRLAEQRREGDHPPPRPRGRPAIPRLVRYPGHDPLYGQPEAALRLALLRWMFGSGRYHRYLWPLVVADPAFEGTAVPAEQRPEVLREGLTEALARALTDAGALADRLWAELAYLDELEPELAHWYAVTTLAGSGASPPPAATRQRVREEVAIAHGAASWTSMMSYVADGRLLGVIPLDWVEEACEATARARSAAARSGRPTGPRPLARA